MILSPNIRLYVTQKGLFKGVKSIGEGEARVKTDLGCSEVVEDIYESRHKDIGLHLVANSHEDDKVGPHPIISKSFSE